MRAIVLSAGQGKRLLPLTISEPKCLLPVDGDRCVLEVQLRAIANCGIEHASIFVGFGAEKVEHFLDTRPIPGLKVDAIYNPLYATTDNLITCWLARHEMTEDFLLLNGDTLFEDEVLRTVLEGPRCPATVTINHKATYDEDDMKVTVDPDGRLRAVGKKIPLEEVTGESIGMLLFRDSGVPDFRATLERAVRTPDSLNRWYLSVVNELAQRMVVRTMAITGLWWQEIDEPADLDAARAGLRGLRYGDDEPKEPIPPVVRVDSPGSDANL
jgi:choline kinase